MRSRSRCAATILLVVFVLGTLGHGVLRAADARGKIEAGKPGYLAKNKEQWKDKGRVVGKARNAPAFALTVFDASGKQVKTVESSAVRDGVRVYELQWLEAGEYTLKVTADGYDPLELAKLEVRPNHDLRIDLEFTR